MLLELHGNSKGKYIFRPVAVEIEQVIKTGWNNMQDHAQHGRL